MSVQSSVMASSPLPHGDERRADAFKASSGKKPGREELARAMGVEYTDKASKTYLRGRVKEYVSRYVDMSKAAFTGYSYADTIYPVIKSCTSYMNRDVLKNKGLPPWTRTTTQHVIHSIFEDTRRNEGSKEKEASKRKEKRKLGVSLEPEALLTLCFLLT